MKWWVRARLRTKIFVAFSSLIIAVLLATLGFTQIVVSREAERRQQHGDDQRRKSNEDLGT